MIRDFIDSIKIYYMGFCLIFWIPSHTGISETTHQEKAPNKKLKITFYLKFYLIFGAKNYFEQYQ